MEQSPRDFSSEVTRAFAESEYRNNSRELVGEALRAVLKELLNKELAGTKGRLIEIGSGTGGLANFLPPEYESRLVAVDQEHDLLAAQKKLHPERPAIVGDVYTLPFANNSVENIIGFNIANVLVDLPEAIAEIKRALKPGGKLIHILDLIPGTYIPTILEQAYDQGFVPFPNPPGKRPDALQLIKQDDVELLQAALHDDSEFLQYIVDPLSVWSRSFKDPSAQNIGRKILECTRQYGIEVEQSNVFGDIFNDYFKNLCIDAGLAIKKAEVLRSQLEVPQQECHRAVSTEANYFMFNRGEKEASKITNPALRPAPGNVIESVVLNVLVAQK